MNEPAPPATVRLVVPVHDEGAHLAAFLEALVAAVPTAGAPATSFVVVDDGSAPPAAAIQAEAVAAAAARLAGSPHAIALVMSPANLGKGAAIRLGWGNGDGAGWLGFVDGDGAVPAAEVWRLLGLVGEAATFDALLATRLGPGRRHVRRAALRDLQGRAFALAADAVLGLGLHDPQCGLKLFRAARLAPLLPALEERRWLLDLELVLRLAGTGARLTEAPIDWMETSHSKLVAVIDPLRMLVGVVGLRRRLGPRREPAP